MAHTVVWSPRAIDDVEAIAAYIAEDSEFYAASVVRDILAKTRRLSEYPYLGRVVPEFGDEAIREYLHIVIESSIASKLMK
jgi:plasmid stabilization system protein ParE